jgi:hypothetical protein
MKDTKSLTAYIPVMTVRAGVLRAMLVVASSVVDGWQCAPAPLRVCRELSVARREFATTANTWGKIKNESRSTHLSHISCRGRPHRTNPVELSTGTENEWVWCLPGQWASITTDCRKLEDGNDADLRCQHGSSKYNQKGIYLDKMNRSRLNTMRFLMMRFILS